MEIEKSNIECLVNDTLQSVIVQVETKGFPLSSEKTLVFKFMWEMSKIISNDNLKFDFEYVAYKGNRDKFLDLLVWTNDEYKVAFEFKLPKKTGYSSGSDQTNKKPSIYRDIARLNTLVENSVSNIQAGFFICAANEAAYLNEGGSKSEYKIFHNHTSTITDYDGMKLPKTLTFVWNEIKVEKSWNREKFIPKNKFAWLQPIKIIK